MVHAITHARVYVAHLLRMSMVHAIAHARVCSTLIKDVYGTCHCSC